MDIIADLKKLDPHNLPVFISTIVDLVD